MILYFAGGSSAPFLHGGDILESFWYKRDALEAMAHAQNFFLDSGAFTAFTKKVTIKIEDYAAFIHAHAPHITVASSLDAIGNAAQSYANYKELKNLGCQVIPVFHCREDTRWLVKYLDEGCPYLALGGMVPESKRWVAKWLEDLWASYLTHPDGSARVAVHGFGMTILDFMRAYPWYSCDSSSWTYGARYGYVLTMWPNGKPAWIFIGDAHSAAKDFGERHYNNFPPLYQEQFCRFIAKVGVATVAEMKADPAKINEHNVRVFAQWAAALGGVHYQRSAKGLFDA